MFRTATNIINPPLGWLVGLGKLVTVHHIRSQVFTELTLDTIFDLAIDDSNLRTAVTQHTPHITTMGSHNGSNAELLDQRLIH